MLFMANKMMMNDDDDDCQYDLRKYRISSNRSGASNTGRGSDAIVLIEAGP